MKLKNRHWMGLLAIGLLARHASALAAIAVIGNPGNANALTEDQVARIFLGKTHVFPDGKPAKPVDQAEGLPARSEFLDKILHRTEAALKSYWSAFIFTGNGTPPHELEDDEAVKRFVSTNPNAIGYVDARAVDASVKVFVSIK